MSQQDYCHSNTILLEYQHYGKACTIYSSKIPLFTFQTNMWSGFEPQLDNCVTEHSH